MGENTRCHIIDDAGKACWGGIRKIREIRDTNIALKIPIGVIRVTSPIYRPNERNGKAQYTIAGRGEKVHYIYCRDSEYCWFKTKSTRRTRGNIVWRRRKEEVLEHGTEETMENLDVKVQKLGEFGPRGSPSVCYFIPFGILHRTRQKVGIWMTTKCYEKVMEWYIVSSGGGNDRRGEDGHGQLTPPPLLPPGEYHGRYGHMPLHTFNVCYILGPSQMGIDPYII